MYCTMLPNTLTAVFIVSVLFSNHQTTLATTSETYRYTIVPTQTTTTPCPSVGIPCFTLSDLADEIAPNNTETLNSSSSASDISLTLFLEPGHHSLNTELVISNISSLTILRGNNLLSNESLSEVTVTCNTSGKFSFREIDHVLINGIQFEDCVASVASVGELVLEDNNFSGRGSLAISQTANITILESSFSFDLQPFNSSGGVISAAGLRVHLCENVLVQSSHFEESVADNVSVVEFENSTVTMIDTRFRNNLAFGRRGLNVFLIHSSVTAENCTFDNNTVHIVSSGAIYSYKSILLMNNCTFHKNFARGALGGAVYATNSRLVINNSRFLNNSANYDGGALYCRGNTIVTMDRITFADNEAILRYGGAVVVFDGIVNIQGSTFDRNTAREFGGALLLLATPTAVSNCTFSNNIATIRGGAINAILSEHFTAINSKYISNSAQQGGAMHIVRCTNAMIQNSTFVNNNAKSVVTVSGPVYEHHYHGGALFVSESNANITNSLFENNSASFTRNHISSEYHYQPYLQLFSVLLSGGAITLSASNTTINHTDFHHNNVYTAISKNYDLNEYVVGNCYGGALQVVHNNQLRVQNSQFLQNTVNCSFGENYHDHYYDSMNNDTENENNLLAYTELQLYASGGAMWVYGTISLVEESVFFENVAHANGGMVDLNTNLLSAQSEGGALYARNSLLTIKSNNFSENFANATHTSADFQVDPWSTTVKSEGGALNSIHSNITIEECNYIGNRAYAISTVGDNSSVLHDISSLGGAVHVENSRFVVDSTLFLNNIATIGSSTTWNSTKNRTQEALVVYNEPSINHMSASSGGALNIFPNSSVRIINCDFESNVAMLGGGVSIFPNEHPMRDLYETLNNYTENPGGTTLNLAGFVIIENSYFSINNAVANAGGALWVSNAIVRLLNSTFVGNKAGGNALKLIDGTYSYRLRNGELQILDNATAAAGGISFTNSTSELHTCTFTNNTDTAVVWVHSSATMENNIFENNSGILGGAVEMLSSSVEMVNTVLLDNKCSDISGSVGGLISIKSNLTIENCSIVGNQCQRKAFPTTNGAVSVLESVLVVRSTTFADNRANNESGTGGAISASFSTVFIDDSLFLNCSTSTGGAVYSSLGNVTISNSEFHNNKGSTDSHGGAVFLSDGPATMENCIFSDNGPGEAIAINSVSFTSWGYLIMTNNTNKYLASTFYAANSTAHFNGNTVLSNNIGPLLASNSNLTFAGYTNISNNTFGEETHTGGIIAHQSDIVFTNQTILMHNSGKTNYRSAGAMSISESRIFMYGEILIAYNTATHGAGIYMYQSEVNVFGVVEIVGNRALESGGGIYAASSNVRLKKGSLHLRQNEATQNGGGMYLKTNSKIYITKVTLECRNRSIMTYCLQSFCNCNDNSETWLTLNFTENRAHLGGAVYVTDETNSDTCVANISRTSDCFFQSLGEYVSQIDPALEVHMLNTHFINNSASGAGETIFGGLLDRCQMNRLSDIFELYNYPINALSLLTEYNVTNLQQENIQSEISSFPVRVCFCQNNEPDCSYRPRALHIRKGERFTVSVVAVDQVNNTISNTTIYSSVSPLAGLNEGQAIQDTSESCTNLTYNVVSPHDSERLSLYAEGPCKDLGMSATSMGLVFTPCPVGFTVSDTSCDCDPQIYPDYVLNCSIDSESVLRRDNAWISYDNTTSRSNTFLTHPHCPFDYCKPPNEDVWINMNLPMGEDVQCAFNRSGMLCGACKEGLSLVLGSSRCLPCSNHWLALVIPFALAGVALVAFLLVCNMTVDVGTINSLIFYANIIATNKAILAPIVNSNVLGVFVAWLNLDIGIETCFFNGMDGYIKVWLQLAFPLYVILLVILIIVICKHSKKITELLYMIRKNLVSTLATLILLSYTKLLTVIIAAFSFTTIEFQNDDGSHSQRGVWLIDPNVSYFEWKHIILFITALGILILGTVYTIVVFSLQWLMQIDLAIFKWVRNPYLLPFLESYHRPYELKHRYWAGLFLIVRVFLYLVYALNIQGDPSVNLLTILCVCVTLLVVSNLVGKIYKDWPINVLEVSVLFNLTLLSASMLYIQETKRHHYQSILARLSIAVVLLTFLIVLGYHMYEFIPTKPLKRLKQWFTDRILAKKESDHSIEPKVSIELDTINEGPVTYTVIDGLPPIDGCDTATFENNAVSDEKEIDSDRDEDDDQCKEGRYTIINLTTPQSSATSGYDSRSPTATSSSESGEDNAIYVFN